MTTSKFHGVGRRKASVARVWLTAGTGKVVVNGKTYEEYFSTEASRVALMAPFAVVQKTGHFDVQINVVGGGVSSQSGAGRLGIARALLKSDEMLRGELKQAGFLSVDSRVVERKKPGQKGARAKFQFVKR